MDWRITVLPRVVILLLNIKTLKILKHNLKILIINQILGSLSPFNVQRRGKWK